MDESNSLDKLANSARVRCKGLKGDGRLVVTLSDHGLVRYDA